MADPIEVSPITRLPRFAYGRTFEEPNGIKLSERVDDDTKKVFETIIGLARRDAKAHIDETLCGDGIAAGTNISAIPLERRRDLAIGLVDGLNRGFGLAARLFEIEYEPLDYPSPPEIPQKSQG